MGLRSRNIKPGFFRNELLATLPMATRLLFIGLWQEADREGRFEYRPRRLQAEIFPYNPDVDIEAGVHQLARLGFLHIYKVENWDCPIGQIVNFKKHQTPHHTEKQSTLPACSNFTVSSPLTHGEYPSDSLIPDSLIPDSKSVGANAPARTPKKRPFEMPEGFQPNESHKALAAELGLDLGEVFANFRRAFEN
jgi:hypothetical protein